MVSVFSSSVVNGYVTDDLPRVWFDVRRMDTRVEVKLDWEASHPHEVSYARLLHGGEQVAANTA